MAEHPPWGITPGSGARTIADALEAAIDGGALAQEARLPTVRELAAQLEVSTSTVAAAYRMLRQRGLIRGSGRAGTTVEQRGMPNLRRGSAPLVPAGVHDLASGNPDPHLLPELDTALKQIPAVSGLYGDMAVLPQLSEWAGACFTADGVPADHVVVVGGALDGTERALSARLRPGDRVAVEDPAHCGLLDLLAILRYEPASVLTDEHGMSPEGLERVLAAGAKAVVITPRMQNPTGSAVSAQRSAELAAVLARHSDVLLVENDHAALISDAPLHTLTGQVESWVAMRSVSKAFGPDLRLGILAADARTASRITKRQAATGWVSHFLQRVVATLIADPGTTDLLAMARQRYRERRSALVAALASHGVVSAPGFGYNVWIPLPGEATVVQSLHVRGWAVRPGEVFRIASAPGIRVTTSQLHPPDADRFAADLAGTMSGRERTSAA